MKKLIWLNRATLDKSRCTTIYCDISFTLEHPPTTQLLPALGTLQATHILLQGEAEQVVAFPLGTAKTDLKVMIQRKPRIVALIPRSLQRAANTVAILLQKKILVSHLYKEHRHYLFEETQGLQINFFA